MAPTRTLTLASPTGLGIVRRETAEEGVDSNCVVSKMKSGDETSGSGATSASVRHSATVMEGCCWLLSLMVQLLRSDVGRDLDLGHMYIRNEHKFNSMHLFNMAHKMIPKVTKLLNKSYGNQDSPPPKQCVILYILTTLSYESKWSHEEWCEIFNEIAGSSYWHTSGKVGGHPASRLVVRLEVPKLSVGTNTEQGVTKDAASGIAREVKVPSIASPSFVCSRTDEVLPGNDSLREKQVTYVSTINPGNSPSNRNASCSNAVLPKLENKTVTVRGDSCLSKTLLFRKLVLCPYCGKAGHTESSCWRKQGLCLVCGGQHRMVDCPQYIKPVFTPTCSVCSGKHLGKDCDRFSSSPASHCNWCGKRGHVEEDCWFKHHACLLCGSLSHELTQCHKYLPRSPMFPPWCHTCDSQHLGTVCDPEFVE